MDKIKLTRYISIAAIAVGVINKVLILKGHGISEGELDVYIDMASAVATLLLGISLDSSLLKKLSRGDVSALPPVEDTTKTDDTAK